MLYYFECIECVLNSVYERNIDVTFAADSLSQSKIHRNTKFDIFGGDELLLTIVKDRSVLLNFIL